MICVGLTLKSSFCTVTGDLCGDIQCFNGATCETLTVLGFSDYSCICAEGFAGDTCAEEGKYN